MHSPVINEHELDLVVKALKTINPGRSSAGHIKDMVNSNWPFENIATGGWVAYAEAPSKNNNVRIALSAFSVVKYLEAQPTPPDDVWGSDPDHPVEQWQYEVENDDTRLGYWDWVAGQQE